MKPDEFRSDDRGVGFQLILMLIGIVIMALLLSMLSVPVERTQNFSDEHNDGTHYEEKADEMDRRITDAWRALPIVGVGLAGVSLIVMAVVLSSRGV